VRLAAESAMSGRHHHDHAHGHAPADFSTAFAIGIANIDV
jgi:hypothetical protein